MPVFYHWAMTNRKPPALTILYLYCTGGAEMPGSHHLAAHSACAIKLRYGLTGKFSPPLEMLESSCLMLEIERFLFHIFRGDCAWSKMIQTHHILLQEESGLHPFTCFSFPSFKFMWAASYCHYSITTVEPPLKGHPWNKDTWLIRTLDWVPTLYKYWNKDTSVQLIGPKHVCDREVPL